MSRKTYRTYYLKSLVLRSRDKEGHPMEVVFRGGIQIDSTAKFSTDDKRIQEALEGSSGYGRDFYLESEEKTEEPAPVAEKAPEVKEALDAENPPIVDFKDSRRFRNLVEMKNAMKELGIELKDDANYSQAKAIARKEGYDFQIKR